MYPRKVTKEVEAKIIQFVKEGETYETIGKALDISPTTASKYAKMNGYDRTLGRNKVDKPKKAGPDGPNKDRHLCKKCQYRHSDAKKTPGCDYYCHTDVMRSSICTVENCTLFVEGKKLTKE